MAFEGERIIFSLGKWDREAGHQIYFLLSFPKNDFFAYLENLPMEGDAVPKTQDPSGKIQESSHGEQIQKENEPEALQVFDEQGRLATEISVDEIKDFDWGTSEATVTFSKPGERDSVVAETYDELNTVTDQKKLPAGFSILADYDEGSQQFFVVGRLRLRVHSTYAEEWMRQKNYVLIRDNQTGELMQAYNGANSKSVLEEVNAVMKEVLKKTDKVSSPVPIPSPASLVSQAPIFSYDYPGSTPQPVPTQDFKAAANQTLSLDSQGRPVSMSILQGKIFLDWTKKTAAFIRSIDGTRVDYAQISLEENESLLLEERQRIAEFSQGERKYLILGRPDMMSYTDGSYDWILSMRESNIAFFSSDGTLLDIHFDGQSLRENLQTAEVLLEMQLNRPDDEQLILILNGLKNIVNGVQTHLDTGRFLNDPSSLLQIQEMLDEAGDVLNNFTN